MGSKPVEFLRRATRRACAALRVDPEGARATPPVHRTAWQQSVIFTDSIFSRRRLRDVLLAVFPGSGALMASWVTRDCSLATQFLAFLGGLAAGFVVLELLLRGGSFVAFLPGRRRAKDDARVAAVEEYIGVIRSVIPRLDPAWTPETGPEELRGAGSVRPSDYYDVQVGATEAVRAFDRDRARRLEALHLDLSTPEGAARGLSAIKEVLEELTTDERIWRKRRWRRARQRVARS